MIRKHITEVSTKNLDKMYIKIVAGHSFTNGKFINSIYVCARIKFHGIFSSVDKAKANGATMFKEYIFNKENGTIFYAYTFGPDDFHIITNDKTEYDIFSSIHNGYQIKLNNVCNDKNIFKKGKKKVRFDIDEKNNTNIKSILFGILSICIFILWCFKMGIF
jgi:hypothetical protein